MRGELAAILVVVVSLTVSVGGLSLIVQTQRARAQGRDVCRGGGDDGPYVPGSCTIFAVRRGEKVFFGNNEDWTDPKTIYWVEPSAQGQYGSVYLGFNRYNPQGGINEKGLAFDFNALPKSPMKSHGELPRRPGPLINMIMQQAATVEEAMAILRRYDWGGAVAWQMLLADATGDAVVVSAGPEGEMAFTRKSSGDGLLVSTNFNRANPDNRLGSYPCPRYEKAVEMLGRIQSESDLTVEALRAIVDAVHVEGAGVNTVYSNVMDLRRGAIYLYYGHQYGEVVILDVAKEIAKGSKFTPLRDLFSRETIDKAEKEHQDYVSRNH
jgi:hypothetical protein